MAPSLWGGVEANNSLLVILEQQNVEDSPSPTIKTEDATPETSGGKKPHNDHPFQTNTRTVSHSLTSVLWDTTNHQDNCEVTFLSGYDLTMMENAESATAKPLR